MTQEQLIRCIEQQLDDLSYLNEDLFNEWCDRLYTENDEPIVERFTLKVLNQLTSLVSDYDTAPIVFDWRTNQRSTIRRSVV